MKRECEREEGEGDGPPVVLTKEALGAIFARARYGMDQEPDRRGRRYRWLCRLIKMGVTDYKLLAEECSVSLPYAREVVRANTQKMPGPLKQRIKTTQLIRELLGTLSYAQIAAKLDVSQATIALQVKICRMEELPITPRPKGNPNWVPKQKLLNLVTPEPANPIEGVVFDHGTEDYGHE
jgi:hypothetical protein